MRRTLHWTALVFTLLAAGGVAACQGCHSTALPAGAGAPAAADKPTVRLYVVSTVAGALEPCGCSKDQLGGIDHLAAFVASQAAAAPASAVLGAGPMLFLDPRLRSGDSTQDSWKAEALAGAFKDVGLAAWAPGANDWAGGAEKLASYRAAAGAALLAGNLAGMTGTLVREVGGVKLGIVGVSDPRDKAGAYPDGVRPGPSAALAAMEAGLAEVKRQGATVLIGLAALPRGEALRLADKVPELHVLVIGKPVEAGDANDAPRAPVLAGTTLVVEAANHLQTVGVIDLFVRAGSSSPGQPLVFADAGGIARADELLTLSARMRELEVRIDSWERDHTVRPEDLAARKADLDKLRAEKAAKEAVQPEVKGSFFRYLSVEVRDKLGREKAVADEIAGYYKRVNEHNKTAFAGRLPPPPEPGQASYVGVDACTDCHDDARKFWDKTSHAHAYPTLQKDFKEYNLDCVSCHVTGYDKPGGSTVTHNEKLQNVQCENCHGPGSLHAKDPGKKGLIVASPKSDLCVGCHHPPHVEAFDPKEKLPLILGPGHGQPKG